MSAEEPSPTDEQLNDWLSAYDEALAVGIAPPALDSSHLSPEQQARLKRRLASLHLLHRAMPRGLSGSGGRLSACGPGGQPLAGLPWTRLGRFELRGELGRGGFGIVFQAYDSELRREVALKVPYPEAVLTPELRERFRREARAASGLDHPNVVPVYEAGEVGPVCFIVSAYCPGVTLAQWLRARAEPVPFRDTAALAATLADAVQHAHSRGVVHRDLKPANVLLQKIPRQDAQDTKKAQKPTSVFPLCPLCLGGDSFLPKITDFGLAKVIEGGPEAPTRSGAVLGTAGYMAPEQARGQSRGVGPAADVYALGAVLYELLTGRPPFRGESDLETLLHVQTDEPVPPSRLRPRTPRDLQTICLKCLRKEPERRYASAGALADDLRRYLAGQPIKARPVGAAERLRRWCRRNPTLAAVSGLAAAALLGVTVLGFSLALHQSQAAERIAQREREARGALAEARRQSALERRQRAFLALDQGLTLCEKGEVRRGMHGLVRSIEIAATLPADDASDIDRVARLNLAAWGPELSALKAVLAHQGHIISVAFSPDGRFLLTGSQDGAAQLWDAATGARVGPELRHGANLYQAALSPDGQTVATGGMDGIIRLWGTSTGRVVRELKHPEPRHPDVPLALAFSPDGIFLLSGGTDWTPRLWRVATGERIADLPHHPDIVRAVAFSPDGRLALTGCHDGRARLWDVATRQLLQELKHLRAVLAVAFSPDGKTVLTGSADQQAQLWDAATGRPLGQPLSHQGAVNAVAFRPDGKQVMTAAGWQARLWDVATGRPVGEPLTSHGGGVGAVAFRADGRAVLTGSLDNAARLWELAEGDGRDRLLVQRDAIQQAVFSGDSRLALTAGFDSDVRLWDGATGRELRRLEGHAGRINAVAFSPDARLAATAGDDTTAWVWDVATGKPRHHLLGHTGKLRVVAFSPDGANLLTAGEDDTPRLWDAASGACRFAFPQKSAVGSWAVAFSGDGDLVLIGSLDGVARLWSTATGRQVHAFASIRHISSVALSPDGRLAVTAGGGGEVCFWDVATGEQLGPVLRHQRHARCLAMSTDGRRLVTGSSDNTGRAWDVALRRQLGPPVSHQLGVRDVAISPDGALFVTASFDNTARLWDTLTSRPVGPALLFRDWAVSAAFRPDGRAFLVGSSDGTARLREVAPAAAGEAERLRQWVEVLTGTELDAADVVHILGADAWHARRAGLR